MGENSALVSDDSEGREQKIENRAESRTLLIRVVTKRRDIFMDLHNPRCVSVQAASWHDRLQINADGAVNLRVGKSNFCYVHLRLFAEGMLGLTHTCLLFSADYQSPQKARAEFLQMFQS